MFLMKINISGKNRIILFRKPVVQWPNGLTIDYVANRLYWTDAKKDSISSCRFDGSDFKIVLEKSVELSHPFGMAIHKNLLFWDDWTHHSLFLADKNSGKGIAQIVNNVKGAMDVKAFSYLHRQGQNSCSKNNGFCSHLCIPLPEDRFTCLCPDGLKAVNVSGSGQESQVLGSNPVECKCPDGSDVLPDGTCQQQDGTCNANQFTCSNGKCIPK